MIFSMDPHKGIDLDAVANFLREGAPRYHRVKAAYEGMREVKYTDLKPEMIDNAEPSYALANTSRYIDSIARGGRNCLAQDTFFLDYDLWTNLLGKVVYGEIHCVELSFRVDWVLREVVARLYTGKPRKVIMPNDLRRVLEDGMIRDLTRFVDMTGIYSRHVTRSEAQRLVPLFLSGASGQCKLTRMVKGCLIYLDHLESGTKTYARADLQTINYKAKELLSAMSFRNTAYVYTKQEDDPACNLILYAMCQQYPGPLFGGVDHVKIPADGDDIYLVGYSPVKHYHNVVVSPEHIMGTLIEYSNQFWLWEELESAMIIACSLRQNRYLDVVGLPAVVSQCDLIYPSLSWRVDEAGVREKTLLSKEAAVMLGRFHQMACLVLFKDIDTSYRNDEDRNRTMKSLLRMDGCRLIEYMEDQMSSGMLQMSNGMDWLQYLDDDSMERLRKYSVFEGFWLVKSNPGKVLKDGIIRCLKRGVNDQNSIRIRMPGFYTDDSFDVLKEEVILGGGDSELKFADGAFIVNLSCIRMLERPRQIESFTHEGTIDYD